MAKRYHFDDLIIWQNDNYWIINKPPLVSTLSDRNDDFNILSMAKGADENAQVCHRLDKETSGALIIAKNPEAYRHVSMQFENREVNKIYHAVCDGIHDFKNLKVENKILKASNGTVRIDRKGKEALTTFNTLDAFRFHTLVECRPLTGRMHQIRIHLAHNNAPITGDTTYGGKYFYLSSVKHKYNLKRDTEERPLIGRQALHAFKVEFKDLSGEQVAVEAEYPKDFKVLVKQLDKNR